MRRSMLTAAPSGPSAYALAVLADNPYLWWRLNESTGASTAADSSGNSRTGSYNGPPTFGVASLLPNDPDPAISSASISEYVQRTGVGLTGLSAFSIEMWFKANPPSSGDNNVVEVTGTSTQFRLLADASGTCSARGGSTSGGWTGISGLLDNARHHVVFATTGGSAKLYIDGVQSGTTRTAPASLNISTIKFGSAISNGTAFAGGIVLDEFAVYTSDLSARVAAHYAAA